MVSSGSQSGVPVMTAQHAANDDVKTRFVTAMFGGDWETVGALIHPDFELHEPDALPYGGVYKGLEGFKQCMALIPKASHITEKLDTVRRYYTEDPDRIVTELHFLGSKRRTGEKFSSRVLEEFTFRDGKIFSITLFWYNIPAFEKL